MNPVRAKAACVIAADFLVALAAVRVIGMLVGHLTSVNVRAQAAMATSLLVFGATWYSARDGHSSYVKLRRISFQVLMGVMSLAALRFVLGGRANISVLGPASLGLIFIAAAGEEIVFRVTIPAVWNREIRSFDVSPWLRGLTALLIAQVLFALSHFVTAPRLVTPSMYDVERLVVAGLAYSLVVGSVGWGITAGLHAAINARLLDVGFRATPPAIQTLHLTGLLLAIVLVRQCSTSPFRDVVTGRLVEGF